MKKFLKRIKRHKLLIATSIFLLLTICFTSTFYFFNSDNSKNSNRISKSLKTEIDELTYIKIKINPEFMIGINKDNVVKSFVALNSDANIYDVKEILNLPLEDCLKKIVKINLDNGIDFDKAEVKISIVNNNNEKEMNKLYDEIKNIFISISPNTVLEREVLSKDEIEKYEEEITNATFVIIFKDWDGKVLDIQTIEYGKSATAPSAPVREGYNFTGWDKDFSNIKNNIEINANYNINSYKVTFMNWDEKVLDIQTIEYGKSATAPSAPVREGYNFTGWDKDFSNIKNNIEINANYNINSYKVTFMNWDEKVLDIQTIEYGKSATAPSAPYRSGSNFIGWSQDFSNITKELKIYPKYNNIYSTTFFKGTYLVGNDIPAGEYVIFADTYKLAFYYLCPDNACISKVAAGDDSSVISADAFKVNTIVTINAGEYLKIIDSYAVPFEEVTNLNGLITNYGMYKVGVHIPAGTYKISVYEGCRSDSSVKVFNNSRREIILEPYTTTGLGTFVNLANGQYVRLSCAQLIK